MARLTTLSVRERNTRPPEMSLWGAPPEAAVKLVAADVDTLVTETATDTLYTRRWNTDWQKVDRVPALAHADPAFDFPHPSPPGEVVDSIQAAVRGEAGTYTEYALLTDGSIWVWKYTQPGMGLLVAFVYGLGGAGVGLIFGIGLSFWVWRRLRRWRSG